MTGARAGRQAARTAWSHAHRECPELPGSGAGPTFDRVLTRDSMR
ncbi:MAG: hypothetical protein AVDCRST_MAG71-2785 [uncultured Lysobacter sp.]|uniref:Uncharacterized protein n=1 Tax=uncultured Lysobacter sp. TaxID=271060 RepID=A0A6J4M7E7_9GAMM|nr:MAG: hypothetical protein AVDCRST_MAG71-2785 [uncultured Lysobacter sp.]